MAMLPEIIWEVRTDGDDTNGGGFAPLYGVPGIDYTLQPLPQIVFDGVTNSLTIAASSTLSATTPLTADLVGNVINITGGSGFTTQRVQITSFDPGNSTITCSGATSASLGTIGSTGGTGKLGGALATPSYCSSGAFVGNIIYLKLGTYTINSSSLSSSSGPLTLTKTTLIGYNTNRYPGNTDSRSTFIGTVDMDALIRLRPGSIHNIVVTSTGSVYNGIKSDNSYSTIENCKFIGVLKNSIEAQASANILNCEVVSGTAYGFALWQPCLVYNCYMHDSSQGLYGITTFNQITNCVIDNCDTGIDVKGGIVSNCTVTNCNYPLKISVLNLGSTYGSLRIYNCIFTTKQGHSTYKAASIITINDLVYNSVFSNTTYTAACISTNVTTGTPDPFIPSIINPIYLSETPFIAETFQLNKNTNGGLKLTGTGYPSSLPGLSNNTNYTDIGALQLQMPTTGTGGVGGSVLGSSVIRSTCMKEIG